MARSGIVLHLKHTEASQGRINVEQARAPAPAPDPPLRNRPIPRSTLLHPRLNSDLRAMPETPSHQRFFAELKRRHVFRIAAVYGGVGFVIVQAADVFVPALHLPPWIMTAVALLVVLGFPIAILIAWAFELTPEGLRKTEDATPDELDAIGRASCRERVCLGV